MNYLRRICLSLTLAVSCLLPTTAVPAQIRGVRIGVDGLTCSQCTRSVEMQLRRLKFVERVDTDLDSAQGRILLRGGVSFAPESIARSVSDAGFSLRFILLMLERPGSYLASDSCVLVGAIGFRSRGPLPADRVAAWRLILPVAQFIRKREPSGQASGCGSRTYDAVVNSLKNDDLYDSAGERRSGARIPGISLS